MDVVYFKHEYSVKGVWAPVKEKKNNLFVKDKLALC